MVNGPEYVCLNCSWTGQEGELIVKYRTIYSLASVPDEVEPYLLCPNCHSEDIDWYEYKGPG